MSRAMLFSSLLVLTSGCAGGPGSEIGPGISSGKKATFQAKHAFSLEVPAGAKKLQAWLPMPSKSDRMQKVSHWNVKVTPEHATRVVRDRDGNNFLYIEAQNPTPGNIDVVTTFRLTRSEVKAKTNPAETRPHTPEELAKLASYLEGSSQSVIDENAQTMARAATNGEKNPLIASRRIYDAVLEKVEYHVKDPKEHKTWGSTGTGSSVKCFETGCGNCTDFHSLYAAVSRAAGIPTRAVYGSFFKGPLNGKDQDQSYHCWIEFHAPGIGWVPIDVAVADIFVEDFQANEFSRPRANLTVADGYHGADPGLVDYYFGNLDDRRVSWHWGRDLVMDPPQQGQALLWNPKGYAEVDGKIAKVSRKLTYEEVN